MTASFPGLEAADAVLHDGVRDGLWPGLVAAVGVGERVDRSWVLGDAERWAGGRRPMAADTVFDLASLTKVLATAPSVLLLAERGVVELDGPAAHWLPALDPRITVRQLLTHTSGLPAHVDLRTGVHSPAGLVANAVATPVVAGPGTMVAYSDLGFVALGGLVEAATGHGLGEVVREQVLGRLGSGARYHLPGAWRGRIAATEVVDGRPVVGRVHDENAASAAGPVGHAGLFGTLADVRACLPLWWPGGPLFGDALRADALRDQTDGRLDPETGRSGHRGLGWTCRGDRHDIVSPGWGPHAVSHTGFTGTSIALEAGTRRWAVLLTNHVHFGRGRPQVLAARRRFHAVLAGDH